LLTSVLLFLIISNNNENVENKFCSSYETLERIGEMKLMMKFYLCVLCTLKFIFSSSHWKLFLMLFQGAIDLYLYLLENAKRTVIYKNYSGTRFLST